MDRPTGGGYDRRGTHEARTQSAAERAAAEVFVYSMRQRRVQHFDVALWRTTLIITHRTSSGPKHEVLRRYEPAPPFWPLTIARSQDVPSGYGVNQDAVCIAYEQHWQSSSDHPDSLTVERAIFAPGCRDLMTHASRTNPVFVCEPLTFRRAAEILKHYLIDATISLTEGRGALIVYTHDTHETSD
jgi:hypothetical protein